MVSSTQILRNRLADEMEKVVGQRQGRVESGLEGVHFFCTTRPTQRTPTVYRPMLAVIGQGSKRVYLGEQVIVYDAFRYVVLSAPLPAESEIIQASSQRPFLSMVVSVDIPLIRSLLLEMKQNAEPENTLQAAISVSELDESMCSAAFQLVKAVQNPLERRVLAPLHVRALFFHVLRGQQGPFLRALAMRQGHFHRIARVLKLIHQDCAAQMDVATMAREAHMSTTAFHQHFKTATSLSPLQYLKRTRLMQARNLMRNERLSASEAAYRVGYNSPSQFSREFKRLFGLPPQKDIEQTLAVE